MKLNGWHRLWIFLSVVYLILVASYVIIDFPTAKKIPHEADFYKKLSKRSAKTIIPATYADGLALGGIDVTLDFLRGTEVPSYNLPQWAFEKQKMIELEMPNGHTIAFSIKYSAEDIRIASQEYWKAVEQKASEKRRHLLLDSFLFWLVPCMGLYALGWGINWVHKGFKQKKNAQPGAQTDQE